MLKKSLFITLTLIALCLGGIVYLATSGMLERTVERIAGEAIGVSVDIGGIALDLINKKVTVSGIAIGNPPGFQGRHAITAETIDITLESIAAQEINFEEISVKGSVVNLEINEKGMNVLALRDLANSKEQKEKTANEEVKVIIQHMLIDATEINPRVTFLSGDIGTLQMPALTLTGIGKGKSVTAGDAIVRVLNEYLALVAKQARNTGLLKHVPTAGDIDRGAKDAVQSIKELF